MKCLVVTAHLLANSLGGDGTVGDAARRLSEEEPFRHG
jgi:hypothetical protein